jgi:hypothetical protein
LLLVVPTQSQVAAYEFSIPKKRKQVTINNLSKRKFIFAFSSLF